MVGIETSAGCVGGCSSVAQHVTLAHPSISLTLASHTGAFQPGTGGRFWGGMRLEGEGATALDEKEWRCCLCSPPIDPRLEPGLEALLLAPPAP
jgi:hypothetical protein